MGWSPIWLQKKFLNLVASHKSLDSHIFSPFPLWPIAKIGSLLLWIIAKWLHHKIEKQKNTPELNVAISPNKSSVTSLRTWSGVRDWWMLLLFVVVALAARKRVARRSRTKLRSTKQSKPRNFLSPRLQVSV